MKNKTIAVKIMTVKNIDQVYSTLKSLAGELKVTGWNADFEGVSFSGAETLLGWFLKNMPALKAGVNNFLVASACGDGNGYVHHEDRLLITTQQTDIGLIAVIRVEYYNDNGYHDYSGKYSYEEGVKEITFLLNH